jgi:hypothetical protein
MYNNFEFAVVGTELPVPVLSVFRQCCGSELIESGSMLFCGSGSGSRFRFLMNKNSIGKFNISYSWTMKGFQSTGDEKKLPAPKSFFAYYFLKSHKKSQKQ